MQGAGQAYGGLWAPAMALCWREIVRFFRQRSRVVGALGAPLVFWFLIGSGAGSSFTPPNTPDGLPYLEYFFPGTLVMILLFTSIFTTISLIEDRSAGFLQSVLAAPVPRTSIVVGKVAGAAVLSLIHAAVFLALAPLAGVPLTWGGVILVTPILFLVAFALAALGFLLAWRMDTVQGFHAVMNMGLIPMWFLSGALFPPAGAAVWVKVLMYLNPLTYGLSAIRQALYVGSDLPGAYGPPLFLNLLITFAATIGICAVAVQQARRPRAEGLV